MDEQSDEIVRRTQAEMERRRIAHENEMLRTATSYSVIGKNPFRIVVGGRCYEDVLATLIAMAIDSRTHSPKADS